MKRWVIFARRSPGHIEWRDLLTSVDTWDEAWAACERFRRMPEHEGKDIRMHDTEDPDGKP